MSLNSASELAEMTIIFLAPVALIYSWHFYFTQMRKEPTGWRNRVSLLSLGMVSLTALLWLVRIFRFFHPGLVMLMLMPRADSGSGVDQVEWVESWHRPIFRTLLVALLLCLFGRPRLIAPIAVAAVGPAMFWLIIIAPRLREKAGRPSLNQPTGNADRSAELHRLNAKSRHQDLRNRGEPSIGSGP